MIYVIVIIAVLLNVLTLVFEDTKQGDEPTKCEKILNTLCPIVTILVFIYILFC